MKQDLMGYILTLIHAYHINQRPQSSSLTCAKNRRGPKPALKIPNSRVGRRALTWSFQGPVFRVFVNARELRRVKSPKMGQSIASNFI